MDPKKIEALLNIPILTTSQDIQVLNKMVQFYRCFIKNFASIMSPITKLLKKFKVFEWIEECQNVWENIKHRCVQASILINPNWELEFHIHTYVLLTYMLWYLPRPSLSTRWGTRERNMWKAVHLLNNPEANTY
jgi:hypothetical protein